MLEAQRSLYAAEDALAKSEKTVAMDLVSLYKALGGGWETPVQMLEMAPAVPRRYRNDTPEPCPFCGSATPWRDETFSLRAAAPAW